MEEKKIYNMVVTENNQNIRIDKYIAESIKELTRSFIDRLIKEQKVLVNGKAIKSSYKVVMGDKIDFILPELKEMDVLPQSIDLNIIFEDKDILIINKPQNMVVHPAPGHYNDTIVNAVLNHCKEELSGINGVIRPGIVHRIDKNTSGLLVICKNDTAHIHIAKQLKEHSITRKYEAITYNNFKEDYGTIDAPIGRHPVNRKMMAINYKNGKNAITHYRVIDHLNNNYNHVELSLETGRTHQIRVHLASINHPILGDEVYGPKNHKLATKITGQVLHAKTLGFIHPRTGKYVEFNSELPEYFQKLLIQLKNI